MTDPQSRTTAFTLDDRYRIAVTHTGGPQTSYGWFASEKEAEDFAMLHRTKLGLDRCVSWHVEHQDA